MSEQRLHAWVPKRALESAANLAGARRHAVPAYYLGVAEIDGLCGKVVARGVGDWEPGGERNCTACTSIITYDV